MHNIDQVKSISRFSKGVNIVFQNLKLIETLHFRSSKAEEKNLHLHLLANVQRETNQNFRDDTFTLLITCIDNQLADTVGNSSEMLGLFSFSEVLNWFVLEEGLLRTDLRNKTCFADTWNLGFRLKSSCSYKISISLFEEEF